MDAAGLDCEGETLGKRFRKGHNLWKKQHAPGRNRRARQERQRRPFPDLPLFFRQIHRSRLSQADSPR
jgi:hypothetical protein